MIAGHGLGLDTSRTFDQTTIGWGQYPTTEGGTADRAAVTSDTIALGGFRVDSRIHHWTRRRVLGKAFHLMSTSDICVHWLHDTLVQDE